MSLSLEAVAFAVVLGTVTIAALVSLFPRHRKPPGGRSGDGTAD